MVFFCFPSLLVALPPEKTDGVGSSDEKKVEKENEARTSTKKQLKFEVRPFRPCRDSIAISGENHMGEPFKALVFAQACEAPESMNPPQPYGGPSGV